MAVAALAIFAVASVVRRDHRRVLVVYAVIGILSLVTFGRRSASKS